MTKRAIASGSSETEPESPAVITPDHIQDRVLSKDAGAKAGWSRLDVYEKEFRLGHLACKARLENPATAEGERIREADRYAACRAFDEGWAVCNASWPSGSDLNRVRVYGCPGSFVDHQRASKDFWRRVELNMGINDWMICRRVCGEGYKVAETVISIQPGYKDSTLARFREALDALIAGMGRARG